MHNSLGTYFPKEIVFDIDSRWRYQNKENYTPPYQNRLFSDLFSFKMQNKHKTLFFKSLFVLSGFVAVSIQFYFQYFLGKGTVPLSSTMDYNSNDLLRNTVGQSQYLTWWHLADNTPQLQKMCEIMARLVCHTSLLKDDDPRYKGGSNSMKNCSRCDLSIPETVKHVIMQCPANERAKEFMFEEIQKADNNFSRRCANATDQVFFWLLGKHMNGVDTDVMSNIWIIAEHTSKKMYNKEGTFTRKRCIILCNEIKSLIKRVNRRRQKRTFVILYKSYQMSIICICTFYKLISNKGNPFIDN